MCEKTYTYLNQKGKRQQREKTTKEKGSFNSSY